MRKVIRTPIFIVILLLILVSFIKLYKINGGFVLGEPDERNYLNIVQNFRTSLLPNFDGIILYHSPPLFHYLGFVFSFIFNGYFAIRLVSLLASLAISLILFFFLRSKIGVYSASITSALFLVLPIIVFYSRLGLIEMLIALWAVSFILAFEVAWEKNSLRWAVISGIALGLGLITKYSILPLVGVPLLFLVLKILVSLIRKKSIGFLFSKEFFRLYLLLISVYLAAFLVFSPVTLFNYSMNPFEFKTQIKQDFALGSRVFEVEVVKSYLMAIPSYLGFLTIIFIIIGLLLAIKSWSKNLGVLASIIFLSYTLLRIALYTPRYFVILVPFLTILIGYGFNWIIGQLAKIARKNFNLKYLKTGAALLVGATILPFSLYSLESSYHTTIEQVGQFVKEQNKDNEWVASNYWPSAFVDQVGYKISWYSSDLRDSQTFSVEGKTKYQSIAKPTFDLINKEGGWVIIEGLYSQVISQGRERQDLLNTLKSKQPVKVFIDKSPNWPYFNATKNQFSVYHFTQP